MCLLHAGLVFWIFTYSSENIVPRKKTRLLAQTVRLQEKKMQPAIIPEVQPPISAPPQTTPPPPKKETAVPKNPVKPAVEAKPKPQTTKKPPPQEKKKETVQKTSPKPQVKPETKKEDTAAIEKARQEKIKQQELVRKAQEHLAKIKNVRVPNSTIALEATPIIDNLHVDTLPLENSKEMDVKESKYHDELASRLKLMLKLPEQGDVKLKLTLERSGKVLNVEILSSESAVNKKYLMDKVPAIIFPSYGNYFGAASKYSFTIILQSEL